ncbi:MAG: Holliday junction DNA helicase RuvB [Spirochaetes bacterium GWD1_61_31]|nr:MAG: Holliday junction DNA helicase RuvB [Spirochaetes bacterium GWB1_60_80]OHD35090.1 MAG: Holliday junction DNA helicase RuvB [Spirochaetes bacterium GWC1_61_12]OHD43607.1 MAG: Holliday junction DNA helicase RuvB [Spirochaetes bacterium GWD1_61_31]OHD44099.1 MAG: Holliday junction DNA helicase RuvB [Spirochaetes bacterium GWE1_60_18]OHD61860.1 MAG: Holliday junction DNA helicase RuvB [Spirochaetes bacterium GWF1_60_12]HAW85072.1 Holliday junction branch migration DNA helicase RuvB [Spiroc
MNQTDHPGLVSGISQPEDERDAILRPRVLAEFLGQQALKDNLAVFIQAARQRNEPLDHVFLIGPPGLGKTTLAGIVSREMEAEFKLTSAPALEKPKDLAGVLTTLAPKSVFFIDEIHRLKPAIEEMLYMAMEDGELDFIIGQGPAARTVRIPLPPFTLVGATTRAGMVSSPLISRFGITLRLGFYESADVMAIIRRSAGILDVRLDEAAAALLAAASRGTPRVANRLLRRMRDFAQVAGTQLVTRRIVQDGLSRLEIDQYGLERHDRDVLTAIIEKYGGGPVGAETLAVSTGESVETLEDYVEPYLMQAGFVMRTPRGRVATPLAYQHLGYRSPNEAERLPF